MKTCFKCGRIKALSEFYKHPKMADGHLGKCKDCARRDVANNIEVKLNDPFWVAKERARCRLKSAKERVLGLKRRSAEAILRWEKRNLHKRRAQNRLRRAVANGIVIKPPQCQWCGKVAARLEAHHDDYSKSLEVQWLCTACHGLTRRKPFGAPIERKAA